MKKIYLLLVFAISITLSCSTIQDKKVTPNVELGWDGSDSVVRITDDLGQQFIISHKIYFKLFNNGGYNNLIRYYYENPYNEGIRRYYTPFMPTDDSDIYLKAFKFDYYGQVRNYNLYEPTPKQIRKIKNNNKKILK